MLCLIVYGVLFPVCDKCEIFVNVDDIIKMAKVAPKGKKQRRASVSLSLSQDLFLEKTNLFTVLSCRMNYE